MGQVSLASNPKHLSRGIFNHAVEVTSRVVAWIFRGDVAWLTEAQNMSAPSAPTKYLFIYKFIYHYGWSFFLPKSSIHTVLSTDLNSSVTFSEAILFSPKICLHMLQEYCLFYPDNGKQELINKKLLWFELFQGVLLTRNEFMLSKLCRLIITCLRL